MSADILRHQLIASLRSIYDLEAFGALADLLQGESLALTFLLEHREQEVFPSDLSRELHLSRSRITGALTSLARKGLVTTHHSQADRRRVQVSITTRGGN
jgi:DNA-binding MarR family transcriptional regulator